MQQLELALLLHLLDLSDVHTLVPRALNKHSPLPQVPYGHGLNGSPTATVERAFLFPHPLNNGLRRFCSQRARVQRGPSEAARCASREAPRSLAHHRTPMMMYQQPLIPDPLKKIRGQHLRLLRFV